MKKDLAVKQLTPVFSPRFESTKYFKNAFTLAEVLITLAIIGVVAVLTIPSLISKYNEKIIITNLKKTLSELSQAIKLSEVDNGESRFWHYNDITQTAYFVDTYIAPYFKNVKKCTNAKECGFPCEYGWKRLDGECANESGYFYYMLNGKPAAIRVSEYDISKNMAYVTFYIDVDGTRGESIMGKDTHTFTLFSYTHETAQLSRELYGLHLGGICGYWGCFNQSIKNLMEHESLGNCNINNKTLHSGKECGLVLFKNNWKVPENYPIKF